MRSLKNAEKVNSSVLQSTRRSFRVLSSDLANNNVIVIDGIFLMLSRQLYFAPRKLVRTFGSLGTSNLFISRIVKQCSCTMNTRKISSFPHILKFLFLSHSHLGSLFRFLMIKINSTEANYSRIIIPILRKNRLFQ